MCYGVTDLNRPYTASHHVEDVYPDSDHMLAQLIDKWFVLNRFQVQDGGESSEIINKIIGR